MEEASEGFQDYVWNVARAGGPDERLLAAVMWQMIVDARAVAKRDARSFVSNAPARMKMHERITVLEQANRRMKAWISGPRFRFYCELLGYDPDNAKEGVEEILRGGKIAEITRFIREHGGRKRTDTARSRAGIPVRVRTVPGRRSAKRTG